MHLHLLCSAYSYIFTKIEYDLSHALSAVKRVVDSLLVIALFILITLLKGLYYAHNNVVCVC